MARSEVAIGEAGLNSAGTVTADAVDVSNDHFIDLDGIKDERLLIRLYGGTGDGFTATFAAGVGSLSTLGSLEVAVATGVTKVLAIESARFKDADEYLLIGATTTGTATAATIEAFEMT